MNKCSIFQLNVLRTGPDCTFVLMWGEREQIFASLPYPEKLDGLYEEWKKAYLQAYRTPVRGKPIDAFFWTPSNQEKLIAERTRKALLLKFEYWLGSAELREIRDQISHERVRHNSQNQQKTGGNCVDLLIACNCRELTRLPWEAWKINSTEELLAPIHISRTPINTGEQKTVAKKNPRAKPRILAVLADTSKQDLQEDSSELDLNKDRKAVQLLRKVAAITLG